MITIAASASIHVLIGLVGAWMIYRKNGSTIKYKEGTAHQPWSRRLKKAAPLFAMPVMFSWLRASNGMFDGDVIGRVVWFAAWVPGVIVFSGYDMFWKKGTTRYVLNRGTLY